jgi:hypothetical protein
MKKKNLKNLALKKSSVSNLNGGTDEIPTTATMPIPVSRYANFCYNSWNGECSTGPSELLTACYCLTEWENTCNFD